MTKETYCATYNLINFIMSIPPTNGKIIAIYPSDNTNTGWKIIYEVVNVTTQHASDDNFNVGFDDP